MLHKTGMLVTRNGGHDCGKFYLDSVRFPPRDQLVLFNQTGNTEASSLVFVWLFACAFGVLHPREVLVSV